MRFSVQRDTVALPESSKDIGLHSFVALSNGRVARFASGWCVVSPRFTTFESPEAASWVP